MAPNIQRLTLQPVFCVVNAVSAVVESAFELNDLFPRLLVWIHLSCRLEYVSYRTTTLRQIDNHQIRQLAFTLPEFVLPLRWISLRRSSWSLVAIEDLLLLPVYPVHGVL